MNTHIDTYHMTLYSYVVIRIGNHLRSSGLLSQPMRRWRCVRFFRVCSKICLT
jgi:hypothetical protein